MTKVVGVRFRNAGKIYFFGPGDLELKTGMHVVVETARGVELGTVMSGPREVSEEEVIQPLKPVIRIATEADERTAAKNLEKEKEAFKICLEKIAKHKLDMKLVEAEYTFDNNKLLFYFTADGRIDFRELVKDLAAVFRTRIELRQIGVRDETKIMGGIGICGRPLCCNTYLSDFVPVSIKMAKEQNLSLNPTKISGVCGRLMCCLKNEEETYEYLNSRLPNIGDYVTTDDGLKGEVSSVSVLRQMVKVLVQIEDEKEIRDYKVEQLKFKPKRRRENTKLSAKEMKELAALEDKEENPSLTMESNLIHENERLDELHRNGYFIIQDPGRFCFGMDAVLLSGFARAKQGERVLDLGTGTGIIPILMEAKTEAEDFTALEIQEESADMARRSVLYNHLENKINIVTGDIKDASKIFGASSFDIVTTNPPYMIGEHGISSSSDAKAIARHEVLCDLEDILRESAKVLRPGGRFYMVHRPFRLAEIFARMVAYKIEPKRMKLVYPFVDKEPNMVLIEGLRGGKSRLTVEKPLIVYKPGVYTDEIYDIYGY